jgi:hypothetical protein
MQNQGQPKLFAFKLAEERSKDAKPAQAWKVREGVSVAGCTVQDTEDNVFRVTERLTFSDNGDYC